MVQDIQDTQVDVIARFAFHVFTSFDLTTDHGATRSHSWIVLETNLFKVAESFFKSMKTELIYGNKLISKEQMKMEIFDPSEANRRSNTSRFGTIEKEDIQL